MCRINTGLFLHSTPVVLAPRLDGVQTVVVQGPPASDVRVALWALRSSGVLCLQHEELLPHLLVLNGHLQRDLLARVQVRVVVFGADGRVCAFGQEVLVDLEVALVLSEVRGAVQRSESLLVPLVDALGAVAYDMMDL